MKTKNLAVNALLAAMSAVLGALSVNLGNMKFTFEGLPVLISALLFGPVDAMAVGGLGILLYQLLCYGVTATTLLWVLPYVLCGLLAGLYARGRGFRLSRKQLAFVAFTTAVLVLVLNTGALYIDSKIYGYYSPVFIFGSLPARIAVCLVKAAAYTAVLPGLVSAARRGLGDQA